MSIFHNRKSLTLTIPKTTRVRWRPGWQRMHLQCKGYVRYTHSDDVCMNSAWVTLEWRHMSGMVSQITDNLTVCSNAWLIVQTFVQANIKRTIKAHITGSFWGESTGQFHSQKANNAEGLSMPWRHFANRSFNLRNQNKDIFSKENAFEKSSAKMVTILSRLKCVS